MAPADDDDIHSRRRDDGRGRGCDAYRLAHDPHRGSRLQYEPHVCGGRFHGYARTLTVFVPKLKEAGADATVLTKSMNDNPGRFLAFVPEQARKA